MRERPNSKTSVLSRAAVGGRRPGDAEPKAVIVVEQHRVRGPHRRLTALEPVANRPIVQHVLEDLLSGGITSVVITGAADSLLDVREAVRESEGRFSSVDYVVCRGEVDLARALAAAAPVVGEAPCVVQPADGLLDVSSASFSELLRQSGADLVLLVGPNAADLGEPEPSSLTCHAEVAVFGPGAVASLTGDIRPEVPVDLNLAGRRIAERGGRVTLERVRAWRRYRGDGHDLLELNRAALDRLDPEVAIEFTRSNQIEGRVRIDPSATVRDSVIVGPAVIGPEALISHAYVGAYTSIGAGARLEGSEIERSIVAPGASITHVGGRLASSLVGPDARVFRDFSLPRALRLWVGEGDEVVLC
jgi:glucose-1-phosphate thymidylyltransferase